MTDYPPPPPPPPSEPGGYQGQPGYGPPSGPGGPYPGGPSPEPLADWGTRAVATLIDWLVSVAVVIVGFILAFIAGVISSALGILVGILVYLVAIFTGFYFTYMNGACGQSPGKKIMGIKVVSEETGGVIGGGLGIVRGLAHIVDGLICYVGYLFPLWDPKRQTLADKIMKTLVLSNVAKQKLSVELLKVQ